MPTQVADRIRVMWCGTCEAYHLLLYHDGDKLPFAMCIVDPETVCDIIDTDFGAVADHPKTMMAL